MKNTRWLVVGLGCIEKWTCILWFIAGAVFLLGSPQCWAKAAIEVEAVQTRDRYPAGGSYPILFRIRITDSWYIHGVEKEVDSTIPTVISFSPLSHLRIEHIQFPLPEWRQFDYYPKPIRVFSGSFLVAVTVAIEEDTPAGTHSLMGSLSYQACSATMCLPADSIPLSFGLIVSPPGTESTLLPVEGRNSEVGRGGFTLPGSGFKADSGLWLTLLALLLGGLALNLTPCIYPLIPITVSYFGGRSATAKVNSLIRAGAYIAGLAVTNSLLGVSAALSGKMLGSILQNPLALVSVALVLTLLGLSFFGLWEIRLPMVLTRRASKVKGGTFGAFFMGLTLGVVAAPCIGPFVLGLLTYVGQRGDPFLGFFYFFVLSLGMGIPLAILAVFSGAIDRLPLSGDWMVWVKKLLGWVLMGMACYILGPLIPSEKGAAALLSGVTAAAALHLGWLDRTGLGRVFFSAFRKVLMVVLLGGSLLYFFQAAAPEKKGVIWQPYDETALARVMEEGRPLILDFSADWCEPCRSLEKRVFKDPEIVRLSHQFSTVKVDLTNRQRDQEILLKKYRVRGVPTVLFFDRLGKERKDLRVEMDVGKRAFAERMRALLGENPP
jgi:thiol:disulfide interchange protein DsbD